MKTKRRTISYIVSALVLLFTGGVVAATLILPGILMERESSSDHEVVTPVPADYYSGPSDAVVKNAVSSLILMM